MLVQTATEAPRVSKATKLIVSVILALLSPVLLFHELGHALAWWRAGHPIRELVIGKGEEVESSTVTIGIGRFRFSFTLSWRKDVFSGVGVAVGDEVRATADFVQRLRVHLAGPLANLVVATCLGAWVLTASLPPRAVDLLKLVIWANLFFMVANLTPMPHSDGGHILTLVYARMSGRDYAWETAWHERYQAWSRFGEIALFVLGVLDYLNNWSIEIFLSLLSRLFMLLGIL